MAAELTGDIMYRALVNRDTTYEGIFFAGIKTTGIFCRPSCRARKPKRENVEFFRTAGEAIQNGYRPCAICRPLEYKDEAPSCYDSLSGFMESFKNAFGAAPKYSKEKTLVRVTRISTPLGPMLAGATDDGLCLLEFIDRRMLETQLKRLRKIFNAEVLPGAHPLFKKLEKQLTAYFDGKRSEFDLPLITPGTAFQKAAWKALRRIPYGETRSYREQAEMIGRPEAVRAVARANGDNRIAIIIPCHRVIGSNGKLTGYGGGLWRKEFLLDMERKAKAGGRGATMSGKVTIELGKDEAFALLGLLARHVYDGDALCVSDLKEEAAVRSLCEGLDEELVERFRSEYKKFARNRIKGDRNAP